MCYSEVLLMVCILTDVLLFVKRRSSFGWKVAEDANQKDQCGDAKDGNDGEHVVYSNVMFSSWFFGLMDR